MNVGVLPVIISLAFQPSKLNHVNGIGKNLATFFIEKRVMARLLGGQRALGLADSLPLRTLKANLSVEYNSILSLEENFWAIKSRAKAP